MGVGRFLADTLAKRTFLLAYALELRHERTMFRFPARQAPDSHGRGGKEMQIVEFSEFARRRMAQGQAIPADTGPALPVTDRWAQLHSPAVAEKAEAVVVDFAADEVDFWSDLQFRIAYPTHRLRRH